MDLEAYEMTPNPLKTLSAWSQIGVNYMILLTFDGARKET